MRHTNNFATAIVLALGILLGATTALAESVRVAMPSKSLTFLNYYLADRFGLFKNEELEVSLPVGKADVQLAAVVSGEMKYIAAAGTVLRGAASGLPVKALMFTLDNPTHQDKVIPFIMEDFQLDRKTAEASLREIVKNFSKDGTTADEAVRGDIDFIREQNKLKTAIPLGQVVDYGILREVLAEMKR